MLMSARNMEPVKNNSFRHTVSDKVEIEAGDVKEAEFVPRMKAKRAWHPARQNEGNFSLGLQDYGGQVQQIGADAVQWTKGDISARFGRKDLPFSGMFGMSNPEQAFAFDVIIARRQADNRVRFSVRSKSLTAHPQPRLKQEEMWDLDTGRQMIHQPLNVGGSIALYHDSKQHNEYETGKAFHVYAPVIFDATGRRTLGRWEIISPTEWALVIPQDFWRLATYPLLIDPDLGWSSQGASTQSMGDLITGNAWTVPDNGFASQMKAYLKHVNGSGHYGKMNIVEGEGGSSYLDNAETAQGLLTTSFAPYAFNCADTITFVKGQTYTLLAWGNYKGNGKSADSYSCIAGDIGTAPAIWTDSQTYGSWPAPPSLVEQSDIRLSLWVEYDPFAIGLLDVTMQERAPEISLTERAPSLAVSNDENEPETLIVNGGFDTDTDWTKALFTIAGGKAVWSGSGSIYQTGGTEESITYLVSFEVSGIGASSSITPYVGDAVGNAVDENGSFSQLITAGSFFSSMVMFTSIGTGSLDNVSVKKVKAVSVEIEERAPSVTISERAPEVNISTEED